MVTTMMMMMKLMIVNTLMMTIDRRLVLKRVRCFEPDREGDRSAWPAPTLLLLVKIIIAGLFLNSNILAQKWDFQLSFVCLQIEIQMQIS